MGVAIKLDNLTTAEKISVMERLWEDLAGTPAKHFHHHGMKMSSLSAKNPLLLVKLASLTAKMPKRRSVNRYGKDSLS